MIPFYFRRTKLPARAANPATNAPINAVATIIIIGLPILSIKATLLAIKCSLLLLINHDNAPHNKKSAVKPDKKDLSGF